MEKHLVIERLKHRVRIVLAQDGVPCEYIVEYPDKPTAHKDAIYVGRVVSIVRATQSAFIDIGTGKNAILHVDKDDKTVQPGALLTVQIEREPPNPDKGPRVTRNIQMPGRLCVLSPLKAGVGISQKITDEAQRARLQTAARVGCPPGMGVIVRTMAQEETDEALAADIAALVQRWRLIAQKAQGRTRPGCVQENADAIDTLVRDMITADVSRIICDDAQTAEQIAQSVAQAAPRVEVYRGEMPVMDAMQLETRLAKALGRKVLLKSGASIVIDVCEAMTVIDVNSGKNVRKKDSEETALAVNLEAAQEIARQLRLRDIGGMIVVDFIDMKVEAHRAQLLAALREALSRDRSRVHLGGLSPLGLCEMTRSALRRELRETVMQRCRHCEGDGFVKSPREQAYEVLLALRRKAWAQGKHAQYLLTAPQRLMQAVKNLREDLPCAALFGQCCEDLTEPFTLTQLIEGTDIAAYQRIDLRSGKE